MSTHNRPGNELRINADAWRWALLAAFASPVGGLIAGCAGGWEVPRPGPIGGRAGSGPTAPIPLAACDNPQPFAHPGSGYESCARGFVHRTEQAECASSVPRATTVSGPYDAAECQTDTDCSDGPSGYCTWGLGLGLGPYCAYGCVSDTDCNSDQICLCGDPVGQCVPADCQTDADCESGSLCAAQVGGGCGLSHRFTCQKSEDACFGSADCPGGDICEPGWETGVRSCQPQCVFGRPFYVKEELRQAVLVPGNGWLLAGELPGGGVEPPCGLSEQNRQLVAQHYCDVGLMEHASVAAFARFALQLLQLGAPAELVAAATDAQQDEVRHARGAFSLARHFADRPQGPGVLNLEGALGEGLESVVRAAVIEGCLGETLASLEAAEALANSSYAPVVETLAWVADDERRHAELAWRFVAWALEQTYGDPEARLALVQVVERAFEDGIAALHEQPLVDAPRQLRAYGLLDRRQRHELRNRAIEDVVQPCRLALLSKPAQTKVPRGERPASAHCAG